MRHLLKLAVAVSILAVAVPAAAQFVYGPPGAVTARADLGTSTLRLNLGTALYSAGWYVCHGPTADYGDVSCGAGWYPFSGNLPLVVGAQLDLDVGGGTGAVSLGLNVALGRATTSYYSDALGQMVEASTDFTVWEPTIDYVARIGSPAGDTVGRIRAGGALYLGAGGGTGLGLRLGAGLSLLNTHRFGIGIDMVAEGGISNHSWIGGLQLLVSPELRF